MLPHVRPTICIATMTLYFVAGEASGDTHGASLMTALREHDPNLLFLGRGGPRMRELATGSFVDWSESSSVLGLWEVLKQYGYFRQQFHATIQQIAAQSPDALVLIDYPGFNLRLARALRSRLPRLKIVYYISPQVWAWNRRRIPHMAKWLDLMLCIFPFEENLYKQSGLRAVFVGHPLIEELRSKRSDVARDPQLIGFFPGSRPREVARLLPLMLEVAKELLGTRSGLRFEVAAASHQLARTISNMLSQSGAWADAVCVTVGEATSLMQRASAGVIASGTATLEAACLRLPFVLVYKVSWLTYVAARLVINVKHLGMPNVLANKEVVPEFVQHRATTGAVRTALEQILDDCQTRSVMLAEFDRLVQQLGEAGSSGKAAAAILSLLNAQPRSH